MFQKNSASVASRLRQGRLEAAPGANPETIVFSYLQVSLSACFSWRHCSLEIQTKRQLDLARRSRAHRGYRIYDGRVQVNRVDDAAESRRARRVESGLRLA